MRFFFLGLFIFNGVELFGEISDLFGLKFDFFGYVLLRLHEQELDMILLLISLGFVVDVSHQVFFFSLFFELLDPPFLLKSLNFLDVIEFLESRPSDFGKVEPLHELKMKVFSAVLMLEQSDLPLLEFLTVDFFRLSDHFGYVFIHLGLL